MQGNDRLTDRQRRLEEFERRWHERNQPQTSIFWVIGSTAVILACSFLGCLGAWMVIEWLESMR